MNCRFVVSAALLSLLAVPALAQSEDAPPRAEDLALTLPTDEWYVPKSTLQFGFRMLNSGAKVNFGNLGSVASSLAVPAASVGDVTREYNNGYVQQDSLRANETKEDGTQSSTPGGRYQAYRTEADGSQTLLIDFLSYTPNQSRYWQYLNDSQVANGVLALSTYRATSEGATAQGEEGLNSGVELSMARALSKVGGRFEWGVMAGMTLNSMNAKTGGTVRSTLHTYTDYFQLNGDVPTAFKGGPTFVDMPLPDGTVNTEGIETTTSIGSIPLAGRSTDIPTLGGASVLGNWQIKGAYLLMRVGPTFRTRLSERWGLSGSVGLAGALAGTRYSVIEQLDVVDANGPIIEDVADTESKFMRGFYADVNVDWWATDRAGLFAGVNYQNLDGYDQTVAGRTAKIELGSAVGIRGGFNVRF